MVSTKAKFGNRLTPRLSGLSIESMILGDGMVRSTCCSWFRVLRWLIPNERAFSLGNLNGLGGGHWGRHCFLFCGTQRQAWVPPHMNGDKCSECLRFPTWLCYMSKWLIHIVGPCLLSATAYSKATQLVPICMPPPHCDPTACVGIMAYRGSNSLLPLMLRLFLAFLPLYF